MAKVLKNKYNSTGERCIDACLNYGQLRYVKDDGSPISIEIPYDKYEEAISDFNERLREELIENTIQPKDLLKRGSITYNQAKAIANEGMIRGLEFYEIDGSVETEHILGISGSVEYALAIWNGDSRQEATKKAIMRALTVYGEEFIKSISLYNTVDTTTYIKFAKSVYSAGDILNVGLYKAQSYAIDKKIYEDDYSIKESIIEKIKEHIEIPLIIIGILLGTGIIQSAIESGIQIENKALLLALNILIIGIFVFVAMKGSKFIREKHIKRSTQSIIDMFNEELEKVSYNNLLTKNEYKLILKNITKGEISKLLMDMKGSVNKKISSSTIVAKETKFMLDARKIIVLPNEYEIKEILENLVSIYMDKLNNEYNVKNF